MNGKTHVISTVPFWSIFQFAKCKRLPERRSSHFQLWNETHLHHHHHHHHHHPHHLLESRTGPLSIARWNSQRLGPARGLNESMDTHPGKKGTWWKPQDSMDWYGLVAKKTYTNALKIYTSTWTNYWTYLEHSVWSTRSPILLNIQSAHGFEYHINYSSLAMPWPTLVVKNNIKYDNIWCRFPICFAAWCIDSKVCPPV